MNVIFTCGGTGGHINPAIALANTLRERDPNCKILFVGCIGEMEEQLVPKAGYEIKCLPGSRFFRQLNFKNIKRNVQGVGRILSALNGARKIIKDFQPDVIVGTGGYASFPALLVGSKMGIPTCVHEANAVPGLATRLAAGSADRILVNFAESGKAYKQQEKVTCVGMPVRSEFLYTKRSDARQELGLDERPLIVSAFGSLGAKAMNEAMAEFMKLESENGLPFQHIHATGSHGWKWMPDLVKSKGVDLESQKSIDMREYIYNMPTLMAAADIFISRAGASSCNEIAVSGTPCILIPSPNVTDNHQEKNARIIEGRGGCVLLLEKECTAQRLYEEVNALLNDTDRREAMRKALMDSSMPDSADRICDIIAELAKK
ncbi:MAG: undecaprenyldiphospho-muramoylpentapeptide beta-N-acetylglucosaminyltransferase [Oscillospiraceae bacterium]|nr:undecaprenyldiphospho-muramoylpentapeptide beta-N-acetylglucosaminyltransferase [Oscillospiraceae bacterium]